MPRFGPEVGSDQDRAQTLAMHNCQVHRINGYGRTKFMSNLSILNLPALGNPDDGTGG